MADSAVAPAWINLGRCGWRFRSVIMQCFSVMIAASGSVHMAIVVPQEVMDAKRIVRFGCCGYVSLSVIVRFALVGIKDDG